jgi:hypothetical protein
MRWSTQRLHLCSRRDHDDLRTAPSTAVSITVSTWPMMRTTASPIAISIRPASVSDGCKDGGDDGEEPAITTGAKTGVSSPISDGLSRCSFFRGGYRAGAVAGRSIAVVSAPSLNSA